MGRDRNWIISRLIYMKVSSNSKEAWWSRKRRKRKKMIVIQKGITQTKRTMRKRKCLS